ncbi:MAG: hypothetical protein PHO89_10665, partial [Methylacidiphilaceae bacterium]|nr:hypothetical protein [Candidatus Methylacidiphilaceae bacterium]
MRKSTGSGLRTRTGLFRVGFLAVVLGFGVASAGANGLGTVVHHANGLSVPMHSTNHTASLVSFGGSSGTAPVNVSVPTHGTVNVALALNAPSLGIPTTTLGLPVLPGLLGGTGHTGLLGAAPVNHATLSGTGTLNLGLGVSVPALGVSLSPTVHVPTLGHTLQGVLADIEQVLNNPLSLLT